MHINVCMCVYRHVGTTEQNPNICFLKLRLCFELWKVLCPALWKLRTEKAPSGSETVLNLQS